MPRSRSVFLKALIVFLLFGVIASLFTGLGFLFKDSGRPGSKRTLYALGVRIAFAAALLVTIGYGLASGQLALHAPWSGR
jgi:hypothetical protein